MANADAAADGKLKVFISYSRKDEDFAQELLAGLQLAGFEPYLDKHDIAPGEDWEARLGRLIEAADTVVFVVSPDAVASERCAWEVERTVTLKKRLLPILWRRVIDAQVPSSVRQLNYISFDGPMMSSLTALSTALRTDLGWVREHTRIGEAALRWHARGRNEALLLRGDELATAKAWLASPPQYAPEPTLLHLDFIKASEVAELARTSQERQQLDRVRRYQRRFSMVLALLSILVLSIGAASIFFYRDTQLRESSAFAILSDQYLESGFPDRAMRFALAGLPKSPNSLLRPWSVDAERALTAAYASNLVRFVFTEHHASVHDVAFSPDGTRIASASDDKTARVWDVGRAQQIHVLEGHREAVAYVLFSPDGRRIVTVGHDTTKVWDAHSGGLVSISEKRAGTEMRPVFMADGRRLVIQVDWHDLAILDTEAGRVETRFSGHTNYLNSASISSDGRYLLTASADGTARLWSLADGALVRTFEGHGEGVTAAIMSVDGSRVFTSSLDGSVRIWDSATGQELQQLKYKNDRFTTLVLSKSSPFLIASSYEGHAIVWEIGGSEPKYVFEHADSIIDMQLNADGTRLVTAGWDGRARVWDLASGRRLADLKGHQGRIWKATFQPGQLNVVTSSEDATVRFWRYGERIKSIARMENIGQSYQATSDDSLLFALESGQAYRWVVRDGSTAEEKRAKEVKSILGLCGSERRTLIFARSTSGDLVSGEFDGPLNKVDLSVAGPKLTNLECSPDLKYIAFANDDSMKIHELLSGREIFAIPLKKMKIGESIRYFPGTVRFAPLSSLAVIQIDAYDKEAIIYSLEAMKIIARLDGHEKRISVIDFTPDKKHIVTGSNDGSVRIWSLDHGGPVATLAGHTNTVTCISFAGTHTMLTSSLDRTVRAWDLRSFLQTAVFFFSSDVWSLSPVASTGWFAIAHGNGYGLLDVIGGRRISFGEDVKIPVSNVQIGAGGRLLLTTRLHDFGSKQSGAIHEVRDLSPLVSTTREALLRQACNHGLGNEGARAFSPEEMQTGALRGRPDLRNPCSGVSSDR